MSKIMLYIFIGITIMPHLVLGCDNTDDGQGSPSGQSTFRSEDHHDTGMKKRKHERNDDTTSLDHKRSRNEYYSGIAETPQSAAEMKARLKLTHISKNNQGTEFQCCKDGKGYLTHLSQDENLTDQDFHELFMKEASKFPKTAFYEIKKFYCEECLTNELENAQNKHYVRLLISLGLAIHHNNIDIINSLFGAAIENGQWYFVNYIDDKYNDIFARKYRMCFVEHADIEFMMEHGDKYNDTHFFHKLVSGRPPNFLKNKYYFSHLLNVAAKMNRVDYAEILTNCHPTYRNSQLGKRIRKELRAEALSTAFGNENIALIKCLVPEDENYMITLKNSPLLDALELNYTEAIRYFLSFQKQTNGTLPYSLDVVISQSNVDNIKLFCEYDCFHQVLPHVLKKAICAHHLEIMQHLVEEKGVQITNEHFKSYVRYTYRNQKKIIGVPMYLIKMSNVEVPLDFITVISFSQKQMKEKN